MKKSAIYVKNWTPERYKPNFFSQNFERSFDYCQNQLISHGRIYANSSRTLLVEGNINNLRKKVYISKIKSIEDEFKHFKNYVYIPLFQMGRSSDT